MQATVLTREQHNISRKDMSENALKVLYRLNNNGYKAYLVGGCVRDMLLGLKPKDFDVTTDATPEQVKELFRNCRIIGRRFRLAHVMFGREVIEVATFRGHHANEGKSDTSLPKGKLDKNDKANLSAHSEHGQILRDNTFGTIEEDAERRDFDVNAMYYDISDFSIHDFAGGVKAIENKTIALIGDPETRYREDPVRMIRAVRFSAKLGMNISPGSADIIPGLASLLGNIPAARMFEEVNKLFLSGNALKTFHLLIEYKLFEPLFPQVASLLQDESSREFRLLEQLFINTDNRINNDQRVTPAYLYAALLWYPLETRAEQLIIESGMNKHDAFLLATNDVITTQTKRIMIPKRFSVVMREIWQLQQRLPKRFGRRAYQQLEVPRFRAGYDFLLLRANIEGGDLAELADWWTEFQHSAPDDKKSMLTKLQKNEGGYKRRRRPRKKSAS
jgi:poly(A) polymerase